MGRTPAQLLFALSDVEIDDVSDLGMLHWLFLWLSSLDISDHKQDGAEKEEEGREAINHGDVAIESFQRSDNIQGPILYEARQSRSPQNY